MVGIDKQPTAFVTSINPICTSCNKEINETSYILINGGPQHLNCMHLYAQDDVKAQLHEKYTHGHPSFIDITFEELELHDKKNHDYASGGDPMGNFKRVESILSLYPNLPHNRIVVALTYMLKQLDAILWGLCQNIQHKVEGLDGRFADVHVYTKLARLMWRDMENEKALDKDVKKEDIGTGEI